MKIQQKPTYCIDVYRGTYMSWKQSFKHRSTLKCLTNTLIINRWVSEERHQTLQLTNYSCLIWFVSSYRIYRGPYKMLIKLHLRNILTHLSQNCGSHLSQKRDEPSLTRQAISFDYIILCCALSQPKQFQGCCKFCS